MPSNFFKGLAGHVFGVFKEPTLAEWVPASGPGGSLEIIFMESYQVVDNYGIPYGAPNPTAWMKTSTGYDVKYNDVLTIGGTDYKIREIMPDGHETIKLTLSK